MAVKISNQTNGSGIVYTQIILTDGTVHELPKSSDYGIRYVPDPLLVDNGTFTFVRDACDVLGTGAFKRVDVVSPVAATDALMLTALHDILYSALQTSGGGGGGGGDATAANQLTQIGLETDIKAAVGACDVSLDAIEVLLADVSTATNQATQIGLETDIKTAVEASSTTLTNIDTNIADIETALTGTLDVNIVSSITLDTNVLSTVLATGASTEAKQDAEIVLLTDIKDNQTNGNQIVNASIPDGYDSTLGSKSDTSALTDTGIYSLIALFKRLLEHMTSLISSTFSVQSNTYTTALNAARYATVTSVTAAVNNVSGSVLAANLSRRSCTIWNSGANIVFLGVGVPAVVNSGIRLPVNSGYVFDMCPLNQINAITAAGAATLTIIYSN